MVDITLDAIIRRYLSLARLPMHYYVPMLVIAKQGLDEMHFDSVGKLKRVVLPVSDGNEVTIPSDCVEVVAVGYETGDKIRDFGFDRRLNPRDNSGAAFPSTSDQYVYGQNFNNIGTYLENFYNEYGNYKGKQFGRNVTWDEGYTVNLELGIIRIDNKNSATEVHLSYLTLPKKTSNKSVIHPFAQRAVLEFIGWQKAVYFKEYREIDYRRREFYNEYRKLRARKGKMTATEIKRAMRRNVNLAVKG
jgi:hypothetical protein